jgi:hypothetical protein
MLDTEAGKELAEAREAALHAERELSEIESALVTARGKLADAQHALAREARRAVIVADQKLSKEFRELGGFLDKSVSNLRRGLLALQQNAASVGKDFRHVQTLHRVLSVALFDTPFRDAFGVPDANDRRNFSTFSGVIGQWCDSSDLALARELAALDDKQTEEAA